MDLLRQGRVWEELKLTAVEGERFPRVAEYRHDPKGRCRDVAFVPGGRP